ncbi:hypothetical protein EYF80_039149 [Liparis tanakae]|uniref:Uncharacterized protein n=1 Tax=Liparis tanakae TaxID=230148 RepID=A0A4Z2GAK7_9TELE|nr:hypothetical protein EYF80_039149 [Liparis tanakae]
MQRRCIIAPVTRWASMPARCRGFGETGSQASGLVGADFQKAGFRGWAPFSSFGVLRLHRGTVR